MLKLLLVAGFILSPLTFSKYSLAEELRVFSWDGYVTKQDLEQVNRQLIKSGYREFNAVLIPIPAEGPEQMFEVMRAYQVDISFLTLNYLKMQDDKIGRQLQPINPTSPRLSNYSKLIKELTRIPMGLNAQQKPLYIPWGGGAYGIWANMNKLKPHDLPVSVKDLWRTRWKGKLGLTIGQIQPNIVLVSLALDKPPFYINDLAYDRKALRNEIQESSLLQQKTSELYAQVGQFWQGIPDFNDPGMVLMASYGIGAYAANQAGGNWQLVNFKEGNSVWLDTINFSKNLSGRKLEAAEIFANYFIGKNVQNRVVNSLGMVAASKLADHNPLLEQNPSFFHVDMFWPPYNRSADNVMKKVSKTALKAHHQSFSLIINEDK